MKFSKGDCEFALGVACDVWTAGIDVDDPSDYPAHWAYRIEVHGTTKESAEALRDRVLAALV